ncbi:12211_t:CDS:2 [Ambispora gerdemannii]|uniref:12211_t:CDS:1 n=1 Tax=Ambispora gerdemannii TaxID=144530 RepID=A0A9N8ZRN3_9GLOM|nr:12211_t:CDS:2 [Ambispora gerdemannii]
MNSNSKTIIKYYKTLLYLYLFFIKGIWTQLDDNDATYYYRPGERTGTTASLVGDKLYFIGGMSLSQSYTDLFYLDLSTNFSSSVPAFMNTNKTLANFNGNSFGTTTVGGKNGWTIFLYGGQIPQSNNSLSSPNDQSGDVYELDPSTNTESLARLDFTGPLPDGRDNTKAAMDSSGLIYIWGGFNTDRALWICDTTALKWTNSTPSFNPKSRGDYSVTLLPDGRLIYIGGALTRNASSFTDINQIWEYNTNVNIWINYTAKGANITNRARHSAVLAPDGYSIIVYGGVSPTPLSLQNSLVVMDTRSFTWVFPGVKNRPPTIIPSHHTATMIGDIMVVAFGSEDEKPSKSVYLLDTKNSTDYKYEWVSTYTKQPLPTTTTTINQTIVNVTNNNTSNTAAIIGGAIGGFIFVFALVAVGIVYYHRREAKQNDITNDIAEHGQLSEIRLI